MSLKMHTQPLQILLLQTATSYTNGDNVPGSVLFHIDSPTAVSAVTVQLKGTVAVGPSSTVFNDLNHKKKSLYKSTFYFTELLLLRTPIQRGQLYHLEEGDHVYPFEFVFPNSDTSNILLPPSFKLNNKNFHSDSVHIQYSIHAVVERPYKLGSDLCCTKELQFTPSFNSKSYPVSSICDTLGTLLPDTTSTIFDTKIRQPCRDNSKSNILKRFTLRSNSIKLQYTFSLQAQFKTQSPMETKYGPSSRIIPIGAALNDYMNVWLVTSFDMSELDNSMIINNLEVQLILKTLNREKVLQKRKMSLLPTKSLQATKTTASSNTSASAYTTPSSPAFSSLPTTFLQNYHQFKLSELEKVNLSEEEKAKIGCRHIMTDLYKIKLPSSFLCCAIPETLCPSFEHDGISRVYSLKFTLDFIIEGNKTPQQVSFGASVVLASNLQQDQFEQLPLYSA